MAKKGKYTYDWPRPMVTCDAAVFMIENGKAKLLLIERKHDPFRGFWALPGGFIELDEELHEAASRELAEETGLKGLHLEQIHTFGKCGRDPRGRQITVVYMAVLEDNTQKIKAGDDADKAQWFDIDKLPKNLAFDHDDVAAFAIKRLK